MLRQRLFFLGILVAAISFASAQDRTVLIPKPLAESPLHFNDSADIFGQAYRWFLEGDVPQGSAKLREIIAKAGYQLAPNAYYVVVANFTDSFSPIGMFYNGADFLNTRMYGLKENNLYYIFITREKDVTSYVSALVTSKPSPSQENLLPFLSLFIPIIPPVSASGIDTTAYDTWVDIRQFTVPKSYRKNSDISILAKKNLSDENPTAAAIFDNTSLEHWSYGIATAITSINDVDIIIGNDGTIIVKPKPELDLATFAALNYHFKPVDTKAKSFGSSFHLMGGIRLVDYIEPLAGVGAGFDLGFFDLAIFAGYSVEFANELEEGYAIGDKVTAEEDPFKLKIRGKPRFGLQVKFP